MRNTPFFYYNGGADPVFATEVVDLTYSFYEQQVYTGAYAKNWEATKHVPGLAHVVSEGGLEALRKWYVQRTTDIPGKRMVGKPCFHEGFNSKKNVCGAGYTIHKT